MNVVQEPVRKSILNVVQKNLKAFGLKSYVTRMVYIGEYTGAFDLLQQKMTNIITELRRDYVESELTGLFLIYPKYFIHMIEAQEDIILKHLIELFKTNTDESTVKKTLQLPSYHHVTQRFYNDWYTCYTIPSLSLAKCEGTTMEEISRIVKICFNKIYQLGEHLKTVVLKSSMSRDEFLQSFEDPTVRQYFPERTVVEFLLRTNVPYMRNLESFLMMHQQVPFIDVYNDQVWPSPCDFVPRNVFTKEEEEQAPPNIEESKSNLHVDLGIPHNEDGPREIRHGLRFRDHIRHHMRDHLVHHLEGDECDERIDLDN